MSAQKFLNVLIIIIFLIGCFTCLFGVYKGCKKIVSYGDDEEAVKLD